MNPGKIPYGRLEDAKRLLHVSTHANGPNRRSWFLT